MLAQRQRRDGFSLTEVLIAIFVMSIGLISLMVLFPFGALQMATAIKDDRTATVADNAHVMAKLMWKDAWIDASNNLRSAGLAADLAQPGGQAFIGDMNAPTNFAPAPSLPVTITNADREASYPILIDPIGVLSHQNGALPFGANWVAGQSLQRRIPRRTLRDFLPPINGAPFPGQVMRPVSLMDDMNFAGAGSAGDFTAGGGSATRQVERYGTYNWSYLIRRQPDSRPYEVKLWILVYQRRAIDLPNQETAVPALIQAGNQTITLADANAPLRKGAWILDASCDGTYQQCRWYRIMNIGNPNATGGVDIEVDPTPNVNFTPTPTPLAAATANTGGMIYIFDTIDQGKLAEVFDRGLLTPYSEPNP